MAQITINEVSQNYSYNIGTSSYCTVAMPMTACWGPSYEDPTSMGLSVEDELERCAFDVFHANQAGLESFISTYRGPASNYRITKDYSYQMALTLLTSGYDVAICRLSPGAHAQGVFTQAQEDGGLLSVKAKYPGTFGNNLQITLNKVQNRNYWNLITYIVDANGTKVAAENLIFVFDIEDSSDTILHISEISSAFVDLNAVNISSDDITFTQSVITLAGGTDKAADGTVPEMIASAKQYATARFELAPGTDATDYLAALTAAGTSASVASAAAIKYKEWIFLHTMHVLDILTDQLTYNNQRLILPGWDDQDFTELNGITVNRMASLSPLHTKLMTTAYRTRCAVAYLDIPRSLARSGVWIDSADASQEGYAQKLSNYSPAAINDDGLFATHSALFAPWGQYTYVGTAKQAPAPPSFLALMIQRAMILSQSSQNEWELPKSRKHNLNIGKLAYNVPKALLDKWQSTEGVSLNIIANIPGLGVNVWGNSTLYNVPPATYNALQNLSTRWLINAARDISYKCGISITFQYTNNEAFSKFYAGVSPLLDTMRNVGAIVGYNVTMSADINGLDSVNANSVIGKIVLYVNGVIQDITVDLIALPSSAYTSES